MNAEYRFARAVGRLYGRSTSETICSSCQRSLNRRTYASAASAAVTKETPSSPSSISNSIPDTTSPTPAPRPAYQLKAGVVLSRPPVITRDLHPFERAFYLYQRRLNERLALPFTRYFYYKKGTPADVEWKSKVKERLTPARDIGVYDAYSDYGWADEVLVGAKESETAHQMEILLRDAETVAAGEQQPGGAVDTSTSTATATAPASRSDVEVGAGAADSASLDGQPQVEVAAATDEAKLATTAAEDTQAMAQAKKEEVERPMPRVTEADRSGDVRSLDRLLQRTLFLVVQGADGTWSFPSARLVAREDLAQAAERVITQTGGPNMNTWVVGNHPVGHYAGDFRRPTDNPELGTKELGEKVFFMKARIMAGQANLKENSFGLNDFQWVTKEELQKLVTPRYWSMTRDMLADR